MKPRILPLILAAVGMTSSASAQVCISEDFETYAVPAPGTINLGTSYLTDQTVIYGVGPNLVADGCTYTAIGGHSLYWSDAGYFGLPSKSINSSGPGLSIFYDNPVDSVDFDLSTNHGGAFNVNITAFGPGAVQLAYFPGVVVPHAATVPVSIQAPGITSVQIQRLGGGGSANLDNHVFCLAGAPVPTLAVYGTCGQPGSGVSASGMTPNGQIIYGYSFATGSITANPAGCIGVAVGIAPPITNFATAYADPAGDHLLLPTNGIPMGACGNVHAQALDVGSCTATNVLSF